MTMTKKYYQQKQKNILVMDVMYHEEARDKAEKRVNEQDRELTIMRNELARYKAKICGLTEAIKHLVGVASI